MDAAEGRFTAGLARTPLPCPSPRSTGKREKLMKPVLAEGADRLVVDVNALLGGIRPAHPADFDAAVLAERAGERWVLQDGDDLVGHLVDVPEVDLEGVVEDLADAGLFADDDGDVVTHGLERGDAEGLGDGGHDVEVGHLEHALDVGAAEEAGEQYLVTDAHGGGHLDGSADHVAGAGHDELDVVHDLEDLLGGGEEVLGALLHGDAAEEQDDLLVLVDLVFLLVVGAVGLDGVVDDLDLAGVDAVVVGALVFGQVTDCDYFNRAVHAAAFDVVDPLVDVGAGAVELGGVDVDDQGDALEGGYLQAGGEGHPVMGVHHVEGFVTRNLGGERG